MPDRKFEKKAASLGCTVLVLWVLAVSASMLFFPTSDPAQKNVSEVLLLQHSKAAMISFVEAEVKAGTLSPDKLQLIREDGHIVVFARRTRAQGNLRAIWFFCEKKQGDVHIYAVGGYNNLYETVFHVRPQVWSYDRFSQFAGSHSAFRDETYRVEDSSDCGAPE